MIEIINYERVNKNKIIGYVDIKLPKINLVIRRIAHLQNGDKTWFNFPNFKKEKSDGTFQYIPYCQFEQTAHNTQLFDHISTLVKKYCEENKIENPKPFDLEEFTENDLPF